MSIQLDIDTSVCLQQQELPVTPTMVWPGTDLPIRIMRETADGRWRSCITMLRKGKNFTTDMLDRPAVQMFVLEGEIQVNGETVSANGFAVLGRSCLVEISKTSTLILILASPHAQPPGDASGAHCIRDCFGIEPFVPVIEGKPLAGFERRVLWLDELTGADTRLLKIPGGFSGVGPNWHPVNEEIFCIEGDIQPDDTRPMGPGSFLFNPAKSIHGFHEKTDGGCILLEWHDGPWDLITAPGAMQPA